MIEQIICNEGTNEGENPIHKWKEKPEKCKTVNEGIKDEFF